MKVCQSFMEGNRILSRLKYMFFVQSFTKVKTPGTVKTVLMF